MTDIQTDPQLLEALDRATKPKLSSHELQKQRVSFILGSLPEDSTITREQVEKVLRRQEGQAA